MTVYRWTGAVLVECGTVPTTPPTTTNRVRVSRIRAALASGGTTPPANPRDALVVGDYRPDVDQGGAIGVPVGPLPSATLVVFNGDYQATANNQIIENLDVYGRINVRGFTGVHVRNCIVRGTLTLGTQTGFIYSSSGANLGGLLVEDTRFQGRGNFFQEAMRGGNYTLRRVEIVVAADGIGLNSTVGNVTVEACWMHNGLYGEWTSAEEANGTRPRQSSYYTHNDGIQFHIGQNYLIRGNMIGGTRDPWIHHTGHANEIDAGDDQFNAAILVKQEVDNSTANHLGNILIEKNWLFGGSSTMNITTGATDSTGPKNYGTDWIIRNNRFIRSTWDSLLASRRLISGQAGLSSSQTYILRDPGIGVLSGNVFDDDGTPVPISAGQNNV